MSVQLPCRPANCAEARVCFTHFRGPLCLIGHTHVAEVYRRRAGHPRCEQTPLPLGGEVEFEKGLRGIINPGSVGQPRDGNPAASYGLWDTEAGRVTVRRVEYDVATVQRKMRAAGLPESLAERLGRGR